MPKREVVKVSNAPKHGENPIPICVKIGNMIFPSVINGRDPKEPGLSDDPNKQIAQAFVNMKNIIQAAGGTTDGIAKVMCTSKTLNTGKSSTKSGWRCFPTKTTVRRVMS
jgi:enamine deaminase RidA (YjgF/YER057c/UK114 family)